MTQKEELAQYARVSSYCFFDRSGWTERLLRPGEIEGSVYGYREEGQVVSGLISFDLLFSYWSRPRISSSGIGCVASDPAVRNKGHIRDIMNRLLRDNYGEGKILSFLYPFSYHYYGMFGYGTMGHASLYKFDPSELITREIPEGGFTLFDRSEEQFGEYMKIKNDWSARFHGGVEETAGNNPKEAFLGRWTGTGAFFIFTVIREERPGVFSFTKWKRAGISRK